MMPVDELARHPVEGLFLDWHSPAQTSFRLKTLLVAACLNVIWSPQRMPS